MSDMPQRQRMPGWANRVCPTNAGHQSTLTSGPGTSDIGSHHTTGQRCLFRLLYVGGGLGANF